MKPKLVFVSGSMSGKEVELGPEEISIGRNPARTVVFDPNEQLVSANHALIRFQNGQYVLKDEGSLNGTFVNGERITEYALQHGDVIDFGLGGPSARFVGQEEAMPATAPLRPAGTMTRMLQDAREAAMAQGGRVGNTQVLKEFGRLVYQRSSRRARRMVFAVVVVAVGLTGGVWIKAEMDRKAAEGRMAELTSQIEENDELRGALEQNLLTLREENRTLSESVEAVEARSEAVNREAQRARAELRAAQARIDSLGSGGSRFVAEITEKYGPSVAFLSFTYGLEDSSGGFLVCQLDEEGEGFAVNEDGSYMCDFQGPRPGYYFLAGGEASCTGWLVDSGGWLISNRHCSVPWEYDDDWEETEAFARENGLRPGIYSYYAYFPNDETAYPTEVVRVSEQADVGLLRIPPVSRTPLPLADPGHLPAIGELITLTGYPTGSQYIISRLSESDREEARQDLGSDGDLYGWLAGHGFIYPYVAVGRVGDLVPPEIIHNADDYGGASGSPVFGEDEEVVGVHHAMRALGAAGDPEPFVTKMAVEIRYVWELLPQEVAERLRQGN